MGLLTLALPAAMLVAFSGTALAQANVKIGVIDMQSALLSTKDGQKAVNDQKRSQELQSKQEQYRKTENTISDEAKATLARDIDTMTKNLQRDTDDARQDLDQEQQRVLNELGQKMMQVLQKYANDKQLTLVMDVSGQPSNILFASSTVDITRDIISLYDAAPPMANVAKPTISTTPTAPRPAAPKPATPTPAK